MTTWEERMAAKARAREVGEQRMQAELSRVADLAVFKGPQRMMFFAGSCDSCGGSLTSQWVFPNGGMIDYAFTEDERCYTWVRHIKGPFEDCNRYFSRVYLAHDETWTPA